MKKRFLMVAPSIALLALGFVNSPAFATNARQAIALCQARPGCVFYVGLNGVDIFVDGHWIVCPIGGGDCIIVDRKTSPIDFHIHPGGATTSPDSGGNVTGHSGALFGSNSSLGTTAGGAGNSGGGDLGGGSSSGGGSHASATSVAKGLGATTKPGNQGSTGIR